MDLTKWQPSGAKSQLDQTYTPARAWRLYPMPMLNVCSFKGEG